METKAKEVKGKSATPTNGAETNNGAEVKAIAKKAAAIAESVTREVPKITVQDRFDRLEQFQALERKHTAIKGKLQQLKVLAKSNDTTGAEISISANGEKITMNKGELVEQVINLLTVTMEALNAQTEEEVLSFDI